MWSEVISFSLLLLHVVGTGGSENSSIKILEGAGGSCHPDNCSFQGSVNKTKDQEIKIDVKEAGTYIRIQTNVTEPDPENHATLVFVLTSEVSVKTWRISSSSSGESLQFSATLLPTNITNSSIKLVISTKSDVKQDYRVRFRVLAREEVELKQSKSLTAVISPTSQALFQYKYEDIEDIEPDANFLVKVVNTQHCPVCSMVSIQDMSNEQLYDQHPDMTYGERTVHQTMLNTSAMVISRRRYPDGVNIVLLAILSDEDCYRKTEPPEDCVLPPENKTMRVEILVQQLTEDPLVSTSLVFAFYFGTGLIAVVIHLLSYKCKTFEFFGKFKKQKLKLENEIIKRRSVNGQPDTEQMSIGSERPDGRVDGSKSKHFEFPWQDPYNPTPEDETDSVAHDHYNIQRSGLWVSNAPDSVVDGGRERLVQKFITVDKTTLKHKRARRQEISVLDMAVFHHNPEYFPNFRKLRSELFFYLILLAGIYYTLPVFQLVYYYQETAERSGNLDTCYYNYLCQYPYWAFNDFGHVFSNCGYIISGLLFIFIVWLRSKSYRKLVEDQKLKKGLEDLNIIHPLHTGIPESYGIFYAMGAALTLEGILSGCYHICPTAENFQFDTTFMYCIAVLVFLKVYQFRHCDVTNTAHQVFLAIGVALILEVVGIFYSHWFFWTVFIVLYISFVIIFIIQIYFNWSGPTLWERSKTVWNYLRGKCGDKAETDDDQHQNQTAERSKAKLLATTVIVIVVNLCMAGFILYTRKPGVSRYILAIMMINMALYVTFYIGTKMQFRLRKKNWLPSEGIRKITMMYGVFSLFFMVGAVTFFIKELKTSAGTPAESRNLNDSCCLLIFDNHDMWHFLSSSGLFYLFMFLLTLEDYNQYQPRHKIPVF